MKGLAPYLAKLRVDGFASLGTSFDEGEFVTTPWEIDGGSLLLNTKSDFGEIRMELLDLKDQPVPAYSMDDCLPVSDDGTGLQVKWKQHTDLSGAAGKTVRLRFELKNARLYSYRRAE